MLTGVPDLNQPSARLGGVLLLGALAGGIRQATGIVPSLSRQNSSGVLELLMEAGRLVVLPIGAVTVDTARVNGIAATSSAMEIVTDGLVTRVVPTVSSHADFMRTIKGVASASGITLLADGTMRISTGASVFLLQPQWLTTTAAAAPGFRFGANGLLIWVDNSGYEQVLFAAAVDVGQVAAALLVLDPAGLTSPIGNGAIGFSSGGVDYTLSPDYSLSIPPLEHLQDRWWFDGNGRLFIQYRDGTAQAFGVH